MKKLLVCRPRKRCGHIALLGNMKRNSAPYILADDFIITNSVVQKNISAILRRVQRPKHEPEQPSTSSFECRKVCELLLYQGLLRQGAMGIEASWPLLLTSGQLENLLLYVLDQTMAPSACTCIGTRREQRLAEGARSKIDGPGQKVSKWPAKP